VHRIYATVRPLALNRLRSEAGSLELCAAGTVVSAAAGDAGLLVRGPGIAMPPGEGTLTFWLGLPAGNSGGAGAVGAVELTAGGRVVASRPVSADELGSSGRLTRVSLPYHLADTAFDVEFRVRATGAGPLSAALHVLVDEGRGGSPGGVPASLAAAWDEILLATASPVSVDVARPASRSGARRTVRTVARFLLWPARRFFDPRIQGVLAHTDARHRELLARVELLDARVQELSARVEALQRTDD
jgi:hypothetical protein